MMQTNPGHLTPQMLPKATAEGLYVHVPFCFHKCHYCDFYSITRQDEGRMEKFVERLLREAKVWERSVAGQTSGLRTVFFGGGTPSLLPLEMMRKLLQDLKLRFDLSAVDEWTVEVNPATATLEYCQMLNQEGVNRLSFGAQSFVEKELATLERHHEPGQVSESLQLAKRAGFERLNIDLIYAIPGQTLESWKNSLEMGVALGTGHISCYGLTYEPNTPMAVKKRLGVVKGVEESLELEMFRHTRRRLAEVGWPAYEISNYAKKGEECRHNLMYWRGGNYIGLGPSGASHMEGWRWRNRPHLREWEEAVDEGRLAAVEVEQLSAEQRARELGMLMLRLCRGVNYEEFEGRMGMDGRALFSGVVQRLTKHGLLEGDQSGFWLSEGGLAVADAIAAELLRG
jgi:oxygen-independent coproporphyrinogen-3 oxidase